MAIALYEVGALAPRRAQDRRPPDLEYGKKIEALRKRSGLTQKGLADRLPGRVPGEPMSTDGYRMYVKGYSRISADNVELWASALNLPVEEVAVELGIHLFTTSAESCLTRELIALMPPQIAADVEEFIRDTATLSPEDQANVLDVARSYYAGRYGRRDRA